MRRRNQLRRDIPDATTEVDAIGQLMVDGKASLASRNIERGLGAAAECASCDQRGGTSTRISR